VFILPDDLDFGTVRASVTNTRCPQGFSRHTVMVTVTSTHDGLGYTLGMSPGDFHWEVDTLTPQTFAKGRNVYPFSIIFTPSSTGEQRAIASITLNEQPVALSDLSNIVDLKGKGVCEL